MTSWVYTIAFTVYKQYYCNEDLFIPKGGIIPATLSGLILGASNIAWFGANSRLGFTISFPVVGGAPGIITSLLVRSYIMLPMIFFIFSLSLFSFAT